MYDIIFGKSDMAAIVIRNLPDDVHDALRRLAADRNQPVEAFVREALSEVAKRKRGGIDFERLARNRAALGLYEDGPGWTPDLDDPKLSWKVLGMKTPKTPKARAKRTKK
jgi:plasmid stability protein